MTMFRGMLIAMLTILAAYTAIVIENHGMGLFGVFFGDMTKLEWPGQFNLDFMFLLILSGTWTAWRNHFSAGGLLLAVVAVTGGAMFLTVYLLILSFQENGDLRAMLLGRERAAA